MVSTIPVQNGEYNSSNTTLFFSLMDTNDE